jgi:predicted dehydrogenase
VSEAPVQPPRDGVAQASSHHLTKPLAPDQPIRVAIVGLGRIYDLNVLAYRNNADVDVVALVDPDASRLAERGEDWPTARRFASIAELAASGLEVDAIEALLPIASHADGVVELLGHGWHVNLQKPMAMGLADAQRMIEAAADAGVALRVMDNYLFYEPLARLKALVDDGAIGEVVGYHLKMVASGRGGWEVPWDTYRAQFEQAARGRGILVFDDGWHKLSTALWLFGPISEVRAWVGATEIVPGITLDAPTTVAWEHDNGIRGSWDITLAVDLYLRSDYYTNDERWEVTGRAGFARVNRCTGRGLQEPSLEVYRDGELRGFHALDDDWASSFRASGLHWLGWLRTRAGPLMWDPDQALEVLRVAMAIYESSAQGGLGVDPRAIDVVATPRG